MRNEITFWLSFLNGDKEAFSLLYKHCYRDLYAYGLALGMSDALVRDAIQDVFLRLYTKPSLIKDTTTLRSLLFRSIKNYYFNALKREEKLMNFEQSDALFTLKYRIEDQYIKQEEEVILKRKIDNLMSVLTPRQKEIVYLRFLHEMDYEEIASVMNISEQAARNLIYKAFERVRSLSDLSDIKMLTMLILLITK